jgi:hypothetical protein
MGENMRHRGAFNHTLFVLLGLITLAGMTSCTNLFFLPTSTPTIIPTSTATKTATVTQTATPTHTTTPTPSRTATPYASPTLDLMVFKPDLHYFHGGEFSYQPLWGYYVTYDDYSFGLVDDYRTIVIYVDGGQTANTNLSNDHLNRQKLAEMMSTFEGTYQITAEYITWIDNLDGALAEFTATVHGIPSKGQSVLIKRSGEKVFFAFGFGLLEGDIDRWTEEGEIVFNTILSTIDFLQPEQGTCEISTDNTYGYHEDNPIMVGGNILAGPARESYYLDNLKGPYGEEVNYMRLGSIPFMDTILDQFQVTYGNTTVLLYIDMYTFEPLLAPAGFTCWGPFKLEAPTFDMDILQDLTS